jgi:hypothetical protein
MTDWESIRRKYQRTSGQDQPFPVLISPGALGAFHLDAVDATILYLIRMHAENYDFCALNKEVMAFMVGVTPATASHRLAKLQHVGLIERIDPTAEELSEHVKKGGHTGSDKKRSGNPTYYRTTAFWNSCMAQWKPKAAKARKAK